MNLYKIRTRFVLVALVLIMLPGASYCQALSKQNIIDLHRAAVDDSVLIQKVAHDGIDFEMSSETIIELQKDGISSEVMKALLSANANSAPRPDIHILYQDGKYAELADRLEADLRSRPSDVRTRTLLIMVDLKMGQKELAMKQFENLKQQPSTDQSKLYIAKVNELLASLSAHEQTKAKLTEALRNYNSADARELISQLSASPFQKEILNMYLSLYQGNYDEARKIASTIKSGSSHTDRERIENIEKQITTAETSFNQLTARIEFYRHSPLVPSTCFSEYHGMSTYFSEFSSISLTEYLDLTEKLSQLAPLNDTVLDLIFYGEMIGAKYEDLQAVGDRILKAKGNIKIPFYSNDRYFYVVIDQKNQRLFTQADSHEFTVRYTMKGFGAFSSFPPGSTSAFNSELVPFDLAFAQITGLSQKARSRKQMQSWLVSKSYALKLEPSGVAPNYALMAFVHCSAGADAQETATGNLGKFIVHVIGNPNLKANLAVPEKMHESSGTFTAALLAVYGGMAAAQGNTQGVLLSSQLARQNTVDAANNQAAVRAQEATWYGVMTKQAFTFVEGNDFDSLEKLIGAI